jgi:hypothetical protein
MVTNLRVLDTAETLVFESVTLTRAALVCEQLEAGGLPARLARVAAGYGVLVPSDDAEKSSTLLSAQTDGVERRPATWPSPRL